eukprot:200311-Pyramimonas_sp.AAC.1
MSQARALVRKVLAEPPDLPEVASGGALGSFPADLVWRFRARAPVWELSRGAAGSTGDVAGNAMVGLIPSFFAG